MKRMGLFLLVVMLAAAAHLLVTGPRMKVQPHIRAYQARAPALPDGVVPVQPAPALPAPDAARALTNPLAATPAHLAGGKIYYEYYCIFCHGPSGHGDGAVGQSYVPVPADLAAPRVQAFSDGQLLRAMLTGTGHEPVLERVVPPEHRWPLVLYVRALAAPGRDKARPSESANDQFHIGGPRFVVAASKPRNPDSSGRSGRPSDGEQGHAHQ